MAFISLLFFISAITVILSSYLLGKDSSLQVFLAFSSLEILMALLFGPVSLKIINVYSATDFIVKVNNKAFFFCP